MGLDKSLAKARAAGMREAGGGPGATAQDEKSNAKVSGGGWSEFLKRNGRANGATNG